MPHTIAHILWGVSKHVAFGYLVYSVFQHRRGSVPTGRTASFLLLGSVFPDLVDKPLVLFGVMRYGRVFAHSLFTTVVLIIVIRYITRRWNRADLGTAFGIGYLSHAPVDMYGTVLTGSQSVDTAFLFWPIVVEYPLGIPTPELPVSRVVIFATVMVLALGMWLYDRMPILTDVAQIAHLCFSNK